MKGAPRDVHDVHDVHDGPSAGLGPEYVCADNAGANPLIANRTAIGAWESFDLIDD